MKRKLAGAATMMLVAALAAGCGGDDGGTETEVAKPLTKAEFITRADGICRATQQEIQTKATRLREAGSKAGTLAVSLVAQFLEKTSVPAYERMLGRLRALQPPVSDQQAVDGYVAALAGAIDNVKADPRKYSKNSSPDPFDAANERARTYGLKVCGS